MNTIWSVIDDVRFALRQIRHAPAFAVSAVLVAGGVVCGLLVAAGVTRALSRFFFLVGSTDVITFAGVTGLLGAIALVACYLPARRAMRVDPMIALRHE